MAGGADGWRERPVRIQNGKGLHARAAAKFVEVAEQFDAEIEVARNGTRVSGISIMGLMTLAAGIGCELVIAARGVEADDALAALSALIDRRFDEE